MNMYYICLVVTLAIMCVHSTSLRKEDNCKYASCMLDGGGRDSDLEMQVMFLNFTNLPDNIEERLCPFLKKRSQVCKPVRATCKPVLETANSYRVDDWLYVSFIVEIELCACNNLESFHQLKKCLTPELQRASFTCLTTHSVDANCLLKTFDEKNNCTEKSHSLYHTFVNKYVIKNRFSADI